MNRKKLMNSIIKKRNKKEKAKLAPKSKPSYISKAKRAQMELDVNKTDDNTEALIEDKEDL